MAVAAAGKSATPEASGRARPPSHLPHHEFRFRFYEAMSLLPLRLLQLMTRPYTLRRQRRRKRKRLMETLPWMGPTEEGIDSSMLHLLLMLLLPPSPAWLVRGGGADDAPAMNEVEIVLLVVEAEAAER